MEERAAGEGCPRGVWRSQEMASGRSLLTLSQAPSPLCLRTSAPRGGARSTADVLGTWPPGQFWGSPAGTPHSYPLMADRGKRLPGG